MLDRQIRNAAPRIEPVRRGKRVGRAHVEAGLARAAVIDLGRVRRKLERREDRAEEQPRAMLPRNQVGVLALPAEAGARSKRLFHHGGGIDEHLHVAAGVRDEPARDRLQLRLDDLVVVVALRVDRDRAAVARRQDRERIAVGPVVQPEHDDGARVRPQHIRIGAPRGRRREPVHVAMLAFGDEALEVGLRFPDRIRPRHADDVEAVRARLIGERAS